MYTSASFESSPYKCSFLSNVIAAAGDYDNPPHCQASQLLSADVSCIQILFYFILASTKMRSSSIWMHTTSTAMRLSGIPWLQKKELANGFFDISFLAGMAGTLTEVGRGRPPRYKILINWPDVAGRNFGSSMIGP
jgi:hypothetical protein